MHVIQIEKEGFAVWKRKVEAKVGTRIDLDVKLDKTVRDSIQCKAHAENACGKIRRDSSEGGDRPLVPIPENRIT
jgi:hypothetical protein